MRTFLAALLAASASTVLAEEPLVGILSSDDYPPEAIARGQEGKVTLKIRVSKEGIPIGCTIIESASQALDAAACYAYMRRAKFNPTKDKSGNPIEDDYTTSVVWQLPAPDSHGNRR